MKHFPILKTGRLSVQLRELGIGDAIAIASMPDHLEQAECTAFLRAAIDGVIEDPAQWTVQERTLAVAHYLASVADDGPDFSLGEGRYSDYLGGVSSEISPEARIEIGEIGNDRWEIRHLTGAMAESIERLMGELSVSPRLHWLFGAMAAQMVRVSEELPDTSTGSAFDEWLLMRMKIIAAFPDGDFGRLFNAFNLGQEKLHHLFELTFDDSGIVVLPVTKEGGADGSLPPARFPVRSCLSRLALVLAGKS